ncbi:MAG: hypothetical protein ACR2PZ_25540 [Pseudomonadales bacterium]
MTRFGAFTPDQPQSVNFVLWADDCLLHFSEAEWTAKQREDHEANIVLTAMLQVALTYMGRNKDYAALHDTFKQSPWCETLRLYNQIFRDLFDDVIPESHYHFHPREAFYQSVALDQSPAELLGLYMVSGSNLCLHGDPAAWALSQRVNSKMHFATTAPAAGIPVPETLVTSKSSLGERAARSFFERHASSGVMVKVQGLAGARNVIAVQSLEQAQTYVADFSNDLDVLLQQRLDTDSYTEMTVDLKIADDGIEITNVRQILFAEGLWVGNYISDRLALSERQRDVCMAVGRYVRELGYTAPEGLNCGIDYFVRGDDIVVIEINARWTGGLFPAELLKRLQAEHEHSVAFMDVISESRLPDYLEFMQAHLHPGGGFRMVPMGFSPFPQDIDGTARVYMWQVVIGDYEAFKLAKNAALGASELPTADAITLPFSTEA